jgi:hypothetical protein
MKKILLLSLLYISVSFGFAQQVAPNNIAGKAMRNWLKENWYDGKYTLLGYNYAREQMYNDIDNVDNKITCVYAGYTVDFIPQSSPISPVFDLGISCEHTVPQSFFNEAEPMRSDIHHLFPTYNPWNIERSNHPFAEIPDNTTTKWMLNTTSSSSIPSSNIDAYAESDGNRFEPREINKGNTARAIFYFYTIYTADAIRPIANIGDINTLLTWHQTDVPDNLEKNRNNRIQYYQGNRNFYVDYPEWLSYAWGFSSPTGKPILEFTRGFKNIASTNAANNTFSYEVEISPAPASTENIAVIVLETELDPSYFSVSNNTLTFNAGTSILKFDVSFNSTLPVGPTYHIKFGLAGASANVDAGHYSQFILRLDGVNSVDENEALRYLFYNNVLTLEDYKYSSYTVSDNIGRTVATGQFRNTIDLNHLDGGMYFIQVFSATSKNTIRIIKQ